MRLVRLFPWGNFWGLVAGLWLVNPAQSGVTLDGTLGPAGTLPGPDFQITDDLGQQVGGNLFHSFGQFSIHTSESATFSGPNSIGNIIGRVTGGEVSFIDGALRSTIPGANLYLLNPSGVLFGEHATLDVPGSVHISTADYLRLSDGGRFDARTPANSVLTVAPVAAFGFLSETPAPITMTGSFLQVPEGQTLSLIGGDLTLSNATLYAPAGRIDVATVASTGEVIPTDSDLILQGFGTLGTFTLEHTSSERPAVDEIELGNLDTHGVGGGTIFIRGGQWVSQGGLVIAETYGDQDGRGINIKFTGESRLENNSAISTSSISTGNAGQITLDVGRLSLAGGSNIFTSALGTGRGGNITVNANDAVTIAEFSNLGAGPNWENATAGTIWITTPQLILENGYISSPTFGASNGGSIELIVGRLSLTGGSDIITSTYGTGNAGDIIINATEAVVITSTIPDNPSTLSSNASTLPSNAGQDFTGNNAGMIQITTPLLTIGEEGGINSSTYEGAVGNGGTIDLHVGRLNLTGGGSIFAGTSGAGRGGEIIVNATKGVTIIGAIDNLGLPIGGLSTNASNTSTNDAGTIRIIAPLLTIEEGGSINSSTSGIGNGGSIELNLGQLILTGDSQISASSLPFLSDLDTIEAGNGGEIIVNASEGITITGGSNLHTNATGNTGNAGDITVTTPSLTLTDSGKISAESSSTTGGIILINANHLKLLNNGTITADVFGNEQGDGGNVTINSTNFVVLNGGSITAKAHQGRGGNILVNADHLKLLNNGTITADVSGNQQTVGGNVTINSTNFVALNGSSVTAKANEGQGGNILVNAQVFLHDAANVEDVLNASSQVDGNDGTVQNNAPTTDISGSLVTLDTNYLDAAAQLSHRCGTNDSESRSRFIVRGRGTLPASPDDTLPAPASRCQPLTTSPPTTDEPPATAQPVAIAQPLGFGNR